MKILSLLLLTGVLAACHRPKEPPRPPTAEELGAELAKYPQVFVPLSAETLENVRRAAAFKGADNVRPGDFQPVYEHVIGDVAGSTVSVLPAFSSTWMLPVHVSARPMSPPQFLRALGEDSTCGFAMLSTPKGTLFISKPQILDAMIAARKAGAAVEDIPFTVIHGAAPERR